MNLLHVDSSVLGTRSVSRQLTASVVRAWREARSDLDVVHRDLATTVVGHVTPAAVEAIKFGALPATETRQELAFLEELLAEFLAADIVVIGAPMYNFGIPSQLKTWLDALAQPGRTFKYTERGPQGLAGGKHVVIASSRGGTYSYAPGNSLDFQEPYLATVLKFMGIERINVIRAEGLNMGPDQRASGLIDATRQIEALFSSMTKHVASVAI